MKPLLLIGIFATAVTCASAQSQGAPGAASQAAQHSGTAASEAAQALGYSADGSLRLTSSVAAVPVWMSGAVVVGAGASVAGVGSSIAAAGESTAQAASELWDFGSGDPAARPEIDATIGLPPAAPTTPSKPHDPSPAEMLKQNKL